MLLHNPWALCLILVITKIHRNSMVPFEIKIKPLNLFVEVQVWKLESGERISIILVKYVSDIDE